MLENYDFVDEKTLAYFDRRLDQAPRDVDFALDYVKREARLPQQQQAVLRALQFKCDVLWAQLDALHHAYVAPGHVPPGAFVPDTAGPAHDRRRAPVQRDLPRLAPGVRLSFDKAARSLDRAGAGAGPRARRDRAEILQRCNGAAPGRARSSTSWPSVYSADRDEIAQRRAATWSGPRREADPDGMNAVSHHPSRRRWRPAGADASLSAAMPLLLQSARAGARERRAVDGGVAARPRRGGRARRAADPFLRRRADGAAGPRGAGRPCAQASASTPT